MPRFAATVDITHLPGILDPQGAVVDRALPALGYTNVTEVKVGAATTAGVTGVKATARGSRFSAGVDLHPLPFISLRGAYTLRHGIPGFDLGLGAQF